MLSEARIRYRNSVTGIAIPRASLSRPLHGDQRRQEPWQGASLGLHPTQPPAGDLAGSIAQLLSVWLPQGYPSIETVAEAAGVHARTLRRRLAQEHLTYSGLVEQARFQNAIRLLEDPDAKITDIAFELGYGDPTNFTHAFHRWAGVSPRNYRRQVAH